MSFSESLPSPPVEQEMVKKAQQLLKQFDCTTSQPDLSETDRKAIQAALRCVAQYSDHQIFGVCADTVQQGMKSLRDYAQALGYTISDNDQLKAVDGPIYIKFNPQSKILYSDSYEGKYRGVLVSCQSDYGDGLNEMYGHLPLNLFEPESKSV